jgi:hypothetical protein
MVQEYRQRLLESQRAKTNPATAATSGESGQADPAVSEEQGGVAGSSANLVRDALPAAQLLDA